LPGAAADIKADGAVPRGAKIQCVQPEGNDTVCGPLRDGALKATPIDRSTTDISGLQCPSILDGDALVDAARRSGGTGHLVSDASRYQMQSRPAQEEGIFCEPAGAVAAAGAVEARRHGLISADDTAVCLLTGSGFKDPASVDRMLGAVRAVNAASRTTAR
jgi:threonine synthase